MGFYLRKSFRCGPVRLNLSKSGLGLSAGVKGARVGTGPRGTYVHGGRHGLYYRKHLSTGRSRGRSDADTEGCATALLVLVAIGVAVWVITWLSQHPLVLVAGIVIAVTVVVVQWSIRSRSRKLAAAYKDALDVAFVTSDSPPTGAAITALKQQQHGLPQGQAIKRDVQKIEEDVYQAVLDKALDDGFVTQEEAKTIAALEQVVRLPAEVKLRSKKDIFSAAYIEAIEDRRITRQELDTLNNLVGGLGIPKEEVRGELEVVREIIKAQSLSLPLRPIPRDQLALRTQKSEQAFLQCSAQVLSQRKSKTSPTGHEYTVRRDGTMVVTNKRVLVVGEGTTSIRYADIADLDVDIDDGMIEISRATSARPTFLKVDAPIYTGRVIDLLMEAHEAEAPT